MGVIAYHEDGSVDLANTLQDEGVVLPSRRAVNFVGAGVTVTDDDANARTVVTIPGGGGGGGGAVASDAIWDAKGDLAAGTGADTAAKVTVGANGLKLKAASAAATGLKWDCASSGTLPASPVTGDEYFWEVDATNHVIWHMYFNGTVWVFLGGPPLMSEVATSETTASTTYAALATAGPSIALPGAGGGLYIVGLGADITSAASGRAAMSYDIGGTGAADADRVSFLVGSQIPGGNVAREMRKTFATQLTLTAKYKSSSGTATFVSRYMSLLPVTVNTS